MKRPPGQGTWCYRCGPARYVLPNEPACRDCGCTVTVCGERMSRVPFISPPDPYDVDAEPGIPAKAKYQGVFRRATLMRGLR